MLQGLSWQVKCPVSWHLLLCNSLLLCRRRPSGRGKGKKRAVEDKDEDELQGGEDIMYSDFFGAQGRSCTCPRAEESKDVV